jgi:hypothetical protein
MNIVILCLENYTPYKVVLNQLHLLWDPRWHFLWFHVLDIPLHPLMVSRSINEVPKFLIYFVIWIASITCNFVTYHLQTVRYDTLNLVVYTLFTYLESQIVGAFKLNMLFRKWRELRTFKC